MAGKPSLVTSVSPLADVVGDQTRMDYMRAQVRVGVVKAVAANLLTVTTAGADVADIPYLSSYKATVGDVVNILVQKYQWLVLGKSGVYDGSGGGTPGPPGPAGPTGPQGPTGTAATATAGQTTTTAPGTNATVTNVGSTSSAVFDFAIPRGATGTQGAAGVQGPKGDPGATGPQGPIGNTGPTGPQGAQGVQGPTGAAGSPGGVWYSSTATRTNEVVNPALAVNVANWAVGSGLISLAWDAGAGGRAKVTVVTQLGGLDLLAYEANAKPYTIGDRVAGRATLTNAASAARAFRVSIAAYAANGANVGPVQFGPVVTVPAGGSAEVTVDGVSLDAISGVVSYRLLIYESGGMLVGEIAYFDNVLTEKVAAVGTPVGAYFDGSSPGAHWNGTANASSSTVLATPTPASVPNPHAGDMFLYGNSGDVHRYTGSAWGYDSNIRGPQGPQGNVGLTGPPGPTAVSSDAGNLARLGTDNLTFVPQGSAQDPDVMRGAVVPEGAVTAPPGTIYLQKGATGALWVKETGSGNTGWGRVVTTAATWGELLT